MVFRCDPCGFICVAIAYVAIGYADYAVTVHLILGSSAAESAWGILNILIFNTIIIFIAVSHIRAMTSDPGEVPLPSRRIDFSHLHTGRKPKGMDGWTVCNKCENYRPPRSHHCRICKRCIRKMDHHCPWVNNCVGEFNQKYFIMFLFYVGLACLYAIVMVVSFWFLFKPELPTTRMREQKVMHTIILVVECLLFLLFVIAIGCDQVCAIMTDATLIEQLRKEGGGRKMTTTEAFNEVFGQTHPCLWLIPFRVGRQKRDVYIHHWDVQSV